MNRICLNGKMLSGEEPVLHAANRGFRYGDGLFETIKIVQGKLQLADLHFERLFSGLRLLGMDIPVRLTAQQLEQDILHLCQVNRCSQLARVRLSLFRGDGGLYDASQAAHYLIESWPLDETVNRLNENGLVIDIYPEARKSCDIFSGLKSANFLPYVLAAGYARKNRLNDCLVLNTFGAVADSTIANLFILKEGELKTPSLSEGCVNGTMRKYLISCLRADGYPITESKVTAEDVLAAEEVFLTNAIKGIRWVQQCGNSRYTSSMVTEIYSRYIRTIRE